MIGHRYYRLEDIAIGKKVVAAIGILIVPIALMAYFLITEKNDLIDFTRQEIAGVQYLRAPQIALSALTEIGPGQDKASAAATLRRAEKDDGGSLGAAQRVSELGALLTASGKTQDAIAKTTDLISYLSDTSNITLDPDTDAYFVGDILVNQTTSILMQAGALAEAAHALAATPSDDNKIAFAEARDGVAAAAATLASDLAKAIKGNADGSVEAALAADGKAVAAAADRLARLANAAEKTALDGAASDLMRVTASLRAKADDEMAHLLERRIAGFHAVLLTRLGIVALCVVLGGVASWWVVRSITRPLQRVTGLMGRLTAGELDVEMPTRQRGDEIGALHVALKAFHDAAVERDKGRALERQRADEQRLRAERTRALNESFETSVRRALAQLDRSVSALHEMANGMARDSQAATERTATVAEATEQASTNVHSVATASEELSASIREIAERLANSTTVAQRAVEDARATRAAVTRLSDATGKISEVVGLISDIAGQTNLLALNATIEAARAGEAGKGFAVVAQEVKTLASQTARATEEIGKHIAAIQAAVENVTVASEHIDAVIVEINEGTMSISSAVEQQGAATQEIARSVQAAASGTAEVTSNIARIAETVAAGDRTSRSVLDAAKALDTEAAQLEKDVRVYLDDIQAA